MAKAKKTEIKNDVPAPVVDEAIAAINSADNDVPAQSADNDPAQSADNDPAQSADNDPAQSADNDPATADAETPEAESSEAESSGDREQIFDDRWGIVDAITVVRDSPNGLYTPVKGAVSRGLAIKLEEMGFLESVDIKKIGRGRARRVWRLSNKGKNFLNMSKTWKRDE